MAAPTPFLPGTLGALDLATSAFRTWLEATRARQHGMDVGHRPLILLGAGSLLAADFVAYMIATGRVVALVDNHRAGQTYGDTPYIGDADLADVLAKTPDAIGILCCGSENAIAHFTTLWSVRPQPLLSYFEVMSLVPASASKAHWFVPAFSDLDMVVRLHEKARPAFADEMSRRTLDAIMLYRLTWDARYIAEVSRPEKAIYFEADVMPLTDHEIFVDGGAYNGDTVHAFQQKTNGKYSHIHSFEIDPVNCDAFDANTHDIPNVTLHRVGLWNEPAEMGIDLRSDNGSRISASSTITAPLDAMDNMDLGAVSLIKLDVEGAENQALNGARRLIQTHKPRLAICAYHKPDDFETLLDTLSSLSDDYRLTLRHYSPILFDSVIYAD
ncbi:hypothetical protein AEAC466_14505 [Asticcacaulis sp. AC466]|uniref:FkbM family methyltransferase n=1 Tax=Asticcacaulis sp. AC466 TaxID=1282362 RepID=UPI0003C3E6D7|nr:FkbM family methyltransferase [Asticcacaulis sp. AC466]ESQ83071.1 hypothetical protein AEAC466_14505 [Asticcacaulis sp. AC466]